MNLIGEVDGKIVVFFDDMIDIGGILFVGVELLCECGVCEVYVCVMYVVFFLFVVDWFFNSVFIEVIVTNFISYTSERDFS